MIGGSRWVLFLRMRSAPAPGASTDEAARDRRRRRGAHGERDRHRAGARRVRVRDLLERRGGVERGGSARCRRRGDRPEDAGDGRHGALAGAARPPGVAARHPDHRARQRAVGRGGDARGGVRLRHQAVRQRRAARRGGARSRAHPPRTRESLSAPGGGRPLRSGRGGGGEPAQPRAARSRPPRRAESLHGADPGRERHRQGAGGAPAALLERPRRARLRRRQLQGLRRGRAGERALRARKGIVHRRRRGAGGLLRAGRRGNALSGRDRRDDRGLPGQAPARPAGGRGVARRRLRSRAASTPASSPPPTGRCAPRSRPAAFARTSSSGST